MKITYQKDGKSHIVSAELYESFCDGYMKKARVSHRSNASKADAIQQLADTLTALKYDIDEMLREVKDL